MKKTSMAASALPNSIIQLSQYYEERRPLLFTSQSSLSELTVTSQRPAMDSSYKDLVFIFHTHRHFLRSLIASRHCVGVRGTIHFLTKKDIHTHMQKMDAKTRTR